MPDSEDLEETISDAAQAPRRMRGDEGEVEEHSLPDQIEADRHLAGRRAGSTTLLGLRLRKLVPPGAG